jgi:hypothetical protein
LEVSFDQDSIQNMVSQPSTATKPTCQFKKENGEFCKRSVATGEGMCWQHAKSVRHKLKSLTRNQTIAFVGLLLSLMIGGPSLYFSYVSWRNTQAQRVSTAPAEKPAPLKPPPTMRQFFKEDFPTLMKVTETVPFATKAWSQEVDAQIYVDLPGKAVFVGYFIPDSPHVVEICRGLADAPEDTIADLGKKVFIQGGYIGEASKTAMSDLVFTGRVYVYHEGYLTPKDVAVLTDVYAKKKRSLILRGFDYFVGAQQSKNRN